MGRISLNHSRVVGSRSTKVSVVEAEKTDSPLLRSCWPVGLRYCSLIPKTLAKPWPTLPAPLEDMIVVQQRAGDDDDDDDDATEVAERALCCLPYIYANFKEGAGLATSPLRVGNGRRCRRADGDLI